LTWCRCSSQGILHRGDVGLRVMPAWCCVDRWHMESLHSRGISSDIQQWVQFHHSQTIA
jgi:hypothetical protein